MLLEIAHKFHNFSMSSNLFHATGLFLYPLKTSDNLWFALFVFFSIEKFKQIKKWES